MARLYSQALTQLHTTEKWPLGFNYMPSNPLCQRHRGARSWRNMAKQGTGMVAPFFSAWEDSWEELKAGHFAF